MRLSTFLFAPLLVIPFLYSPLKVDAGMMDDDSGADMKVDWTIDDLVGLREVDWNVAGIIEQEAPKYNVDVATAKRISFCESSNRYNAKSKTSTAKGVYSFIDKTWKHYCSGDVMNPVDNIKCFLILYPKHPTWWECR